MDTRSQMAALKSEFDAFMYEDDCLSICCAASQYCLAAEKEPVKIYKNCRNKSNDFPLNSWQRYSGGEMFKSLLHELDSLR